MICSKITSIMSRTSESFQMLTTQDAIEYSERGESWFYLQFFNSTIFRKIVKPRVARLGVLEPRFGNAKSNGHEAGFVAGCCSVLQCVAGYCSVLLCCSVLQCVASLCDVKSVGHEAGCYVIFL